MEFHRRLAQEANSCPANSSSGCAKQFAPGSLLHYGQGKWYPGEPLPRWALGRVLAQGRRADLEGRFAHRRRIKKLRPRREGREGACSTRIAEIIGVRSETSDSRLRGRVLLHLEGAPLAVERHAGKIQSEGQAGARPHRADFPARSRRGRRLRAADQARVAWQQHGWMSGAWFLRDDDTLWLIPGDSPMGLRLPLDSVPWVAEKDFPWLRQQDPSQPELPELPQRISVSAAVRIAGSDREAAQASRRLRPRTARAETRRAEKERRDACQPD